MKFVDCAKLVIKNNIGDHEKRRQKECESECGSSRHNVSKTDWGSLSHNVFDTNRTLRVGPCFYGKIYLKMNKFYQLNLSFRKRK